MPDFLLELRSEEIPARMQAGARAELEKLFRRELEAAGIAPGALTVWSTPRRLALIARALPDATEAVSEEAKGPPVGAPDAAVDGFCRKNGITRDQLEARDVKGRETWFAVIETPGRATRDVLATAIPAIVRDFSWPKSMRWGADSLSTESLRWVRPLSGIVALLGEDVVECEVHGVTSGAVTLGHRFHHSGDITIGGADDYAVKLRAAHVIVDHEERQDVIRKGAAQVAAEAGLTLVEDEGLVIENAGLTEWPVPLLGRFDEAFLDVPPEVIQLTARVNQKYFVCLRAPAQAGASGEGAQPTEVPASAGTQELANAFVCTANIAAEDGGAKIVDGNRKVLAARLSDARFFWDQDRKKKLHQHAEGLKRITFHEKLGTVADKVERVAKLARWLVEEGIVKDADPDLTEQAARLAKADLVTEMVGEFPELQGLMGGYYARDEGLPEAVADAIRDHYKPVGQGDDVPTAPVTVAVSLADKLDTLVGFFLIGQPPTGSKDPFALRRAALSACSLCSQDQLRVPLLHVIANAFVGFVETALHWSARAIADDEVARKKAHAWLDLAEAGDFFPALEKARAELEENKKASVAARELLSILRKFGPQNIVDLGFELITFITDRLKVQQREAGVRHDLIDAVFALGGEDDLVRLLARVHALQSFMDTEDGTNLLAGYKRAANILKKENVVPAKAGTSGSDGAPPTEIPASAGMTDADLEPHTGEEDPLALVDDPDLRDVIAERATASGADNSLSYTPEPAEKDLIDALDASEPRAATAIGDEDFAAAMSALASLRAPIDRFFDSVTVNDPDPARRQARLALLARFRDAVHRVADFSRIEG